MGSQPRGIDSGRPLSRPRFRLPGSQLSLLTNTRHARRCYHASLPSRHRQSGPPHRLARQLSGSATRNAWSMCPNNYYLSSVRCLLFRPFFSLTSLFPGSFSKVESWQDRSRDGLIPKSHGFLVRGQDTAKRRNLLVISRGGLDGARRGEGTAKVRRWMHPLTFMIPGPADLDLQSRLDRPAAALPRPARLPARPHEHCECLDRRLCSGHQRGPQHNQPGQPAHVHGHRAARDPVQYGAAMGTVSPVMLFFGH